MDLVSSDQASALAKLLDVDAGRIDAIAASHKSFVYLKRQVPLDVAQRAMLLNVPGVYAQPDYRRYYPEGSIVAHVTVSPVSMARVLRALKKSITVY